MTRRRYMRRYSATLCRQFLKALGLFVALLLVTNAYAWGCLVKAIMAPNGIQVMPASRIRAEQPRYRAMLLSKAAKNETPSTPCIIHQTYATEDIPQEWAGTQHSVFTRHRNLCQILFWTDAAARKFIAENYAWFLVVYDSYPYPIQRVDAFRYFLLYHYGGIYVDLGN